VPPRHTAPHVEQIASALTDRYHDHAHGNKADPLDELIYITCSVQTAEKGYLRTYSALHDSFPSAARLAEAPADAIAAPLQPGGLATQKAAALRHNFDLIITHFGTLTLDPLRHFSDQEAEAFLTSLKGVGKKVARCIMMYSLDRQVFPVDTHCWRIARRLGWIRRTTPDGHPSDRDMDRLQSKIPLHLRFSLHVNFLSLGREICLGTTTPRCHLCPLTPYCRQVGVRSKLAMRPRRPRRQPPETQAPPTQNSHL
jgi:endonuclease III